MNTQLIISLDKARELYPTASYELKIILEETFSKKNLILDVTERVKSVQDACYELKINYVDFITSLTGLAPDTYAYECLKIIIKALNEGWKVNWADGKQKKWFPLFEMSSSDFVFRDSGYNYSFPNAGNASRLYLKNEKIAKYSGIQFLSLYKAYIM